MAQAISTRKALREWKLYLFVAVPLLFILLFQYFPAGSAVYHSFFEWDGHDTKRFIGLDNFRAILSDTVLWNSFILIGILVIANVLKLIPSIFVAVMIHRLKSDKAQYWYRLLVVLPMIVPSLVTLFIWKFFFDPNLGPLNRIIEGTGLIKVLSFFDSLLFSGETFREGVPIAWLSQEQLIVPALIIWGFPWIGSVGVLIYLAGLQSISKDVYEAADLDGVTPLQKFFHIELPLIMTQVRLTLILLIIGTLQGFGLQLLLLGEGGGAGGRGMVPGLWMYNKAFVASEFGYACAIGLVLFFFILILTFINNKYVRVDK